jgi:hypothetical protein
MGATLLISGRVDDGKVEVHLYNWAADEPIEIATIRLIVGAAEAVSVKSSIAASREMRVDITEGLRKIVPKDGEFDVEVHVEASPHASSQKRIFRLARYNGRFLFFGFEHFSH